MGDGLFNVHRTVAEVTKGSWFSVQKYLWLLCIFLTMFVFMLLLFPYAPSTHGKECLGREQLLLHHDSIAEDKSLNDVLFPKHAMQFSGEANTV